MKVRVRTPMRLHLGMLDPGGAFGGLGVALNGGYEVEVGRGNGLKVVASKEDRGTVVSVLRRLNEVLSTGLDYDVRVIESIPRHVGLGSTTQLSLAVATAVLRLNSMELQVKTLALILGRGEVSAVGTYVFERGGFVVEGGKQERNFPALVARERVPDGWAFVLVRPRGRRGPDEDEEKPMMTSIAPNEEKSARICRHVLMGLLPAIKRGDIHSFGRHLSEVQRIVGSYFQEEQGGEFREDMMEVVNFLDRVTHGAGQSSWGPTVYGLIKARDFPGIRDRVVSHLKDAGIEAEVIQGIPLNRGATVKEG